MPQSIIRVAKIKTPGQAQGKTKHNYRLMNTPNADPERTASLNQELVNVGQLDYWTLANQRIEQVVTRKVRDDQVRAMEILLSASPEWFKRDKDGQAEDVRGGKWVADNLHFLQSRYGKENVVSFTLHQDEKTPHIHAVIVPITQNEKGRMCLSAELLFNPKTLRQLQTDYAKAMAPHQLDRGIEGSRRQHLDMKQMYGLQLKTEAELSRKMGESMTIAPAQAVELGKVPLLNHKDWREQEQGRINKELTRQLEAAKQQIEAANKRADEAIKLAGAGAEAYRRVKVLEGQLSVSDRLKQGHFIRAEKGQSEADNFAVQLAQGKIPATVVERGKELIETYRKETEAHLLNTAKTRVFSNLAEYTNQLLVKGHYQLGEEDASGERALIHPSGVAFRTKELKPDGMSLGDLVRAEIQRREDDARERTEQAEKLALAERQRLHDTRTRDELHSMNKNIELYHWGMLPGSLLACLMIPAEKARAVEEKLRISNFSWSRIFPEEDSPSSRPNSHKAVCLQYQPEASALMSEYFDRVRATGGEVYESKEHQACREQLQAQPRPVQRAKGLDQGLSKNDQIEM